MTNILADLSASHDVGLLALRIAVGVIFLVHGLQKRGVWKSPPAHLSKDMVPMFKLLSIAEPLGGLAILMGFFTQWAAIGLGIVMLGAIYKKHFTWKVKFAPQGQVGWEYDFILLAANIQLLVAGAGAWSLDRMLFGW